MLSIDWNLLFTIINLVILYLLVKKFLYKPVIGIMEQRQEIIDNQFKSAREAEDKANELKSQWEDNMSLVETERTRILEEADKRAKSEYGRIVSEADKEAEKIIDNANQRIAAEKEKIVREVEGQIAGIAMLAAAKIVKEKSKELDNNAVYDEFLTATGSKNKN